MTGWCHASLPDKQPVANNQWVGEKAEERTTCNFLGNKNGLKYQIFRPLDDHISLRLRRAGLVCQAHN